MTEKTASVLCFTMTFSFACDKAGFATRTADTQARRDLMLRLSACHLS